MKNPLLLCTLLVAAAAAASSESGLRGQGNGTSSTGPLSPVDKPIVLFDGKERSDLSAFYTWVRDTGYEDPRRIFNVVTDEGQPVIHITGDGYGGLITKREYTNYHLVAEYRWGDRTWGDRANSARDSGILLHGIGPDGGSAVQRNAKLDGRGGMGRSPWISSIEFQIIEGGVGDLLILAGDDENGQPMEMGVTVEVVEKARPGGRAQYWWQKGGVPRRITRPGTNRVNWVSKDPELKGGLGARGRWDADTEGQGWTRLEAVMDGDRMTFIVNGVTVMEGRDVTPTAGKLQFQTEMAEIHFRNIVLEPLKK